MKFYSRWLWRLMAYMSLVFVCPLAGAWLSDKPLSPYLEFPPIPVKIQSPAFSWEVFCLTAVFAIIALKPFLSRIILANIPLFPEKPVKHSFPLWGWLGLIMVAISWIVAWNRFEWLESIQEFTFTPLWLSYILIINALTYRRIGQCLLTRHTGYTLILFPLSAILWWSFEYLNRFVDNWYYVGITDFGPGRYFVYATLPFSTVLPAVLGTTEWLNTFPSISVDLNRFKPFTLIDTKVAAICCIVASALGLAALAIWPKTLYSLVWLLPIMLVLGLHSLTEKPELVIDIEAGDWRRLWTLAVSGLICGLFWEMWNGKSLTHWEYSIPYLQRFEIFEMPILGYLGYLPFGVFCGLFADFILPKTLKSR
ncbi:MAG: hypothetical protein ACU85E_07595 [Gammaproteobacteria bacterium]